MEKSVKWLLIIGLIWMILAFFMSYQLCKILNTFTGCRALGECSPPHICSFREIFKIWLFVAIPSWVLFIIAITLNVHKKPS